MVFDWKRRGPIEQKKSRSYFLTSNHFKYKNQILFFPKKIKPKYEFNIILFKLFVFKENSIYAFETK